MTVHVLLCFVMLGTAVGAPYPSTYPYENENFVMPDLLERTPDETFSATDPGGYLLRQQRCDLNDPDWIEVWDKNYYDFCAYNMFYMYTIYGIESGIMGTAGWNCSGNPLIAQSSLTGIINAKTVCTECCSAIVGQLEYANDYSSFHDIWNSVDSAGLCDTMTEAAYCQTVTVLPFLCIQHYIDAGTRTFIIGCYDATWQHLLTCSIYTNSGVTELIVGEEPDHYLNAMSPTQQFVVFGMAYHGERVCLPYSYFFPEYSKDSSSSTPAGDDGSAPADGDDDSSSLSLALGFFSVALISLMN